VVLKARNCCNRRCFAIAGRGHEAAGAAGECGASHTNAHTQPAGIEAPRFHGCVKKEIMIIIFIIIIIIIIVITIIIIIIIVIIIIIIIIVVPGVPANVEPATLTPTPNPLGLKLPSSTGA
jgi:hypothetical protein